MVIMVTYASLILGELVPKRIALINPERIARFVARPMDLLAQGARPLVWLLHVSTELVVRLSRIHVSDRQPDRRRKSTRWCVWVPSPASWNVPSRIWCRMYCARMTSWVGNIMTLREDLYYLGKL
ncbi:MAG: CNNM domain-containing protein [Gammaproteobacteria bacterium]